MVHWGRTKTLPMLDHICHQDIIRARKWHSGVFPTTMSTTIFIIKIPSNKRNHRAYLCAKEPITGTTLPVSWNLILKSIRNVSIYIQKIYCNTGDRWHISKGDHNREDPRECKQKKGWAENKRTTPLHAQVTNTPLRNIRQRPFNDRGIHGRSGGKENLETSKTWINRDYCTTRHGKKM